MDSEMFYEVLRHSLTIQVVPKSFQHSHNVLEGSNTFFHVLRRSEFI